MMLLENDEEIERDPNYVKLVRELRASKVSREEALYLHFWLSDKARELAIEKAVIDLIGTKTIANQILACTRLEECASEITKQLCFFEQVSALDFSLSLAFSRTEPNNTSDSPADIRKEWFVFRNRLAKDTARFAQVVHSAVIDLKATGDKRGRRANEWRNNLFTEIVGYLRQGGGESQNACTNYAYDVWNIYFPRNKIQDIDAAIKIVTRQHRRLKEKGQNSI